ncbi:MAG TPA: hypothetical protein VHV82_01915 [Sporichthyaceae bacterium]|nr:hypothetical protein [Sporichthyaceae bacterium]
MGSQDRPERQMFRSRVLAAAVGGFLLGTSMLGIAPGAQAAVAAVPAATQIADSAEQAEGLGGSVQLRRHHRVRHHHRRHHRHHYRHHHHRRHHTSLGPRRAKSRAIARSLVRNPVQFSCFAHLVEHESGWNTRARNPSSGAYGIPQALPARKLASAGADWRTNPRTQIRWEIRYIHSSYGSPCGAWAYWRHHHWY